MSNDQVNNDRLSQDISEREERLRRLLEEVLVRILALLVDRLNADQITGSQTRR